MQIAQNRREDGHREDFVGRQAYRAADLAGLRRRRVGEPAGGRFHRGGRLHQLLAGGSQRVAGRAALEQDQAERRLERGHPPRRGGLADAQRAPGRERAAGAGDGEEIAKVVPVEHGTPSALLQNNPAISLLVANRNGVYEGAAPLPTRTRKHTETVMKILHILAAARRRFVRHVCRGPRRGPGARFQRAAWSSAMPISTCPARRAWRGSTAASSPPSRPPAGRRPTRIRTARTSITECRHRTFAEAVVAGAPARSPWPAAAARPCSPAGKSVTAIVLQAGGGPSPPAVQFRQTFIRTYPRPDRRPPASRCAGRAGNRRNRGGASALALDAQAAPIEAEDAARIVRVAGAKRSANG